MPTMHAHILILFAYTLIGVSTQDCKVGGARCADHSQCCGGCCFDGECYDTYRNCYDTVEVCKDHVCIGEENCFAFTPPQCAGCGPIAMCL